MQYKSRDEVVSRPEQWPRAYSVLMIMTVSGTRFAVPLGVDVVGQDALNSAFDVSGLAVASIGEAGNAAAELSRKLGNQAPLVRVDRTLAEAWFAQSFYPRGWEVPSPWDAIAGDYRCADGWIRLHTNAAHHKRVALGVLGLDSKASRAEVAESVVRWNGQALEDAVVAASGCAAVMRSPQEWLAHPQGQALQTEELIQWGSPRKVASKRSEGTPERPLQGVKVLDLTRVIAGPVATRFLAYLGANVLRIDPPWWEESALEPEMTVGKHCARLDLTTEEGRQRLAELLQTADIVVQGYRSDALERLGFGPDQLAGSHPHLVVIALDAYGWHGPWAQRRGFDSLVQMSCGIAYSGRETFGPTGEDTKPVRLPVQALDHATGYLAAAAALQAWTQRLDGIARNARLSLARTAMELMKTGPRQGAGKPDALPTIDEQTAWGPGKRLTSPVTINGVELFSDVLARGFGSAEATWVQP